jgi:hypothetical protein
MIFTVSDVTVFYFITYPHVYTALKWFCFDRRHSVVSLHDPIVTNLSSSSLDFKTMKVTFKTEITFKRAFPGWQANFNDLTKPLYWRPFLFRLPDEKEAKWK